MPGVWLGGRTTRTGRPAATIARARLITKKEWVSWTLPERVRVAQTEIAHAVTQAFSRLATGVGLAAVEENFGEGRLGAKSELCAHLSPCCPHSLQGLAAPAAVSDSQEDSQARGWLRTKAYDHGLRPLLTEPERTSMDPGGGQARGLQNRMRVRESKSLRSWPRARLLY